jgi:hypothetical protein
VQEQRDPTRSQSRRLGPAWVTPGLVAWAAALAGGFWALPHLLAAEGKTIKQAVLDHSARPDQLSAAIRRHPADYYLEVLAGSDAVRRRDPAAGKHLNRAQRLNPADPWVHLTTARWLVSTGRRSQAAIEYRLSAERGGPINYDELMATVGPRYLAQAVPQTDRPLMEVARLLLRQGNLRDAVEVSARAVTAGRRAEPTMVVRLGLAGSSGSTPFVREAASDLLTVASAPASFVAAAQALSEVHRPAEADAAINQGLAANPHDVTLVIAGARMKVARDDLTGAAALLMQAKDDAFTLDDRLQIEELRATIAEHRGDHATAAAIRARAKATARMHTQVVE